MTGSTRPYGNPRTAARLLRILALSATLQACVYVPRTTQVFDSDCRVMANHMVLEGGQVAAIQRCENQGCVALIVAASAVTAASVIISGTIVIVGNVAYWFEKKARCNPQP
jgi:type II secretory pathway component PulL